VEHIVERFHQKQHQHLTLQYNSMDEKNYERNSTSSGDEDDDIDYNRSRITRTTKHKKKIEDALLDYGRQLEEHKEQMRQQYLRSQEETFHPNITSRSTTGGEHSRMDVIDRLELLEKERVEKLEQMQKAKEDNYTHKPVISKMSQDLATGDRSDIVQVNRTWVDHREHRLNALRDKKIEEELEEETFAPRLNPNTYKIVNRMRQQKKRDDEGVPFEDYLEKKEVERQIQIQKKTEEHFQNLISKTPKITQRAAEIVREGSVSDRLYEQSFKLNEKRLEYTKQKQMQEQMEYDFTPKVLTAGGREEPVYDHLLKKEEEKRQKKKENMQKLIEREKELHHPKINPVSEEIASRLPDSTRVRLLKKFNTASTTESFPFKPEINSKSRQMAVERSGSGMNRIDRLYNIERKKREKLRQLRTMSEQKELEHCTFQPKTKTADYHAKPFNERSKQWEHKKKQKIARERAVVESKSMQECTFKPNTNAERRLHEMKSEPMSPLPSTPGGVGNTTGASTIEDPLGFDEFVQRHKEARQKKEQSGKGVFVTGSRWQNRLTVPKEFHLGQKRPHIRALRKPLSPSQQKRMEDMDLQDYYSEDDDEEETRILDSTDNSSIHSSSSGEEEDSIIDLLNEVPPQGLFSSRSSVSILEGMHHIYQTPNSNSTGTTGTVSPTRATVKHKNVLSSHSYTSEEWLKRAKQKKNEESVLAK
jgi:hypothetical protein